MEIVVFRRNLFCLNNELDGKDRSPSSKLLLPHLLLSSWISTNSPKATVEEQANKDDVLVPIRLEIDIDGLVLRDTFTWNLNGKG